MNVPGGGVVRTFIAGGVLCDDGDSIARVQETEGCLETRYACPGRIEICQYRGLEVEARRRLRRWVITL